MFSLFNGIYDSYLAPTQLNLLVVGAPESGKTTLLERLKVTEIPSRPRKGMSNLVQQPPATLQSALLKTGAAMGRHSQSRTSLASGNSSTCATSRSSHVVPTSISPTAASPKVETSNEKPVDVKPSKGKAVPVKPKKKNRFMLICPAPARYLRAAQDQDEEYVDDNDDDEEVSEPMNDIFREDSFSGAPPLRSRSHSKEWNVDSLDLSTSDGVDNLVAATAVSNTGVPRSGTSERETSMQSIGLDDDDNAATVPKEPLHTQQEDEEHEVGPALLQSSPQEFNVQAKKKMLPLRMIRPTSKCSIAKEFIALTNSC